MLKVNFPLIALLFLVITGVCAWESVNSNVTTQFDLINVLRCIDANSPVDYRIGSVSEGTLSVHVNYTEVNETQAQAVFENCYNMYGNGRVISLEMFADEDPLETYYGLASELLYGHQDFSTLNYYTNTANNSATLEKRQKYASYYDMYMSPHKNDCSSNEQFYTYSDTCQDSEKQPFRAFECRNYHHYELKLIVWPHHNCDKGDHANYYISPGSELSCTTRRTYSWWGTFSKDECYDKSESDTNCTKAHVDQWSGHYASGVVNYGGHKYYGEL